MAGPSPSASSARQPTRRPRIPQYSGPAVLSGDDILARWPEASPFVLIGGLAVIAGGLVAAVSRPTHFGTGPWLAAYLVLVVGVAQIALGVGQAWLTAVASPGSLLWAEAATWNLGAAGVVAGTLLDAPVLTTIGGIITLVALVLFLVGVRQTRPVPTWVRRGYQGIVVFVLLSIPVGLTLAWLRRP